MKMKKEPETAKKRAGKLSAAAEHIRTVILVLLVVSLVMLVIVYIGGTHIYQNMTAGNREKNINIEKLWSVRSDIGADGLDSGRLLPETIGYRLAGADPVGCIADRESIEELYGVIGSCITELFGNTSYCVKLSDDEGARQMNEAIADGEYIFIRYHQPVLYRMIYAYASGKLVVTDQDVAQASEDAGAVYVSELVIKPDQDVAAHRFIAYVYDGDGGYFRFSQDKSVIASTFYFSRLADGPWVSGLAPMTFSDDPALAERQPLIGADLEPDVISAEDTLVPDAQRSSLLVLFGYNPDKVSSYPDESAVNYVDSRSRLRVGNGVIRYQANDAASGLRLDTLLGYSVNDTLSVYDKLTAVDNIIGRIEALSPELAGGEAKLCLGDVYTDGVRLVIEYFYAYEDVRVGEEAALRAEIEQDRLYSFSLRTVSYKGTDSPTLLPSQEFAVRKLSESGKTDGETGGEIRLVYRDGTAVWSVGFIAARRLSAESMFFAVR